MTKLIGLKRAKMPSLKMVHVVPVNSFINFQQLTNIILKISQCLFVSVPNKAKLTSYGTPQSLVDVI